MEHPFLLQVCSVTPLTPHLVGSLLSCISHGGGGVVDKVVIVGSGRRPHAFSLAPDPDRCTRATGVLPLG
ncbi:hypothetical protein E2C01_019613 [Portunus trituberculatus]|uniref:Uncharacterized protein n=1 Tax=Portunus trituberculatus TaxID=210409 RepID=A0A5B7DZU8_PORTR|nr:hypothetical protein [Portunus trituberculatus]